jgi:hypothetical protein
MHGVPKDLDLSFLRGATLIQLGVGEFQIQFHFHPKGCISVEGDWEVRDSDGSLVDKSMPNDHRQSSRVHVLLGRQVESYAVNPPQSLTLHFNSGHALTVSDNSKDHESFSIQPGNINV